MEYVYIFIALVVFGVAYNIYLAIKSSMTKPIPTFSNEPEYKHENVSDSELITSGSDLKLALYMLTIEANKLNADAVKYFKIVYAKKGDNDHVIVSGMPIRKV